MLGVHVRRVAVTQRLGEELGQRLDAELPFVGVGLAPAVGLMVQRLVMLLLDGVVVMMLLLRRLKDHVRGGRPLGGVALAGVPRFEGRARRQRVGVGLGDLGLGDLGGVDGNGQRRVDVGWRQEGFLLWVEVDWLESRRRLAVGVIHHRVALVVVSRGRIWTERTERTRYMTALLLLFTPAESG